MSLGSGTGRVGRGMKVGTALSTSCLLAGTRRPGQKGEMAPEPATYPGYRFPAELPRGEPQCSGRGSVRGMAPELIWCPCRPPSGPTSSISTRHFILTSTP